MGATMDKTSAPLTVVRTEPEPCRVKLDIEVPVERVREAYEETLKAFRQQARVPGFRPGKTPKALLLRHYGPQVDEECRRQLVREAVREAVEKESLTPETAPRIEDEESLVVSPDRAFVFSLSFDVPPHFELPEYKGLRLSRSPATVADREVDEMIAEWLQSRTSFEKVERAAQAGDLLKVSYTGTLETPIELPETSRFYLSAQSTWLALREPELIPGTLVGLVGVEPGQSRELAVEFPESFNDKNLAGQRAQYRFEVLEVHGSQVPELTDELAKEAGAESVEAMRDRVRENIQAEKAQAQEQALRQQVLTALLSNLDIPLPATRKRVASYEAMMRLYDREMRRGATQEDLGKRQEQLRAQADEEALQKLKRFYLLARLAEAEKIEPDMQRVQGLIQYMAQSSRVTPKVMVRRLQESDRLEELVVSVRETMVLDRLVELAEVIEVEDKKE